MLWEQPELSHLMALPKSEGIHMQSVESHTGVKYV